MSKVDFLKMFPNKINGLQRQLAAPVLGMTLQAVAVQQPEDFESAFAALRTAPADALYVIQDHLLFSHRMQIVDFAAQSQLPAMYAYRSCLAPASRGD